MINIGIGVSWAKALYSVANNIIANFRARVLSYPNSIFEAGPCLDATLEELNAIGLLDNASLIVTPNAYNEGVLYDVIPNTPLGDMDVVRATTATRVNSSGLIEVVPRNLLTYSNNFSNVNWSKVNSTITANQVGYDGTNNASLLVENTATDAHRIQQTPSLQGQTTISVYAKANTRNWLYLRGVQAGSAVVGWFNLSNGTLGTVNTNGTGSITSIGNGWYRCSLTIANFASGFEVYIGLSNADNVTSYLGNGSSIFIQNAQVESFPTATEYFPTTTRLNIPRIDYTNGSCPSLLVEPQRTNLLTYNNTFSDISWFKPNAVITLGTISSPDGLINSSILSDTVTNSSHVIQKTLTVSLGQSYSISIYAKKKDLNFLIIGTTGMGTGYSYFNINNGTIGNVLSGHTAKIINANNGWYKCVITGVTTSTVLNVLYGITATNGTSDYAGTGLGNYIYGTQVELGSYDTSLIPTVASSVTRNADLISKTGVSSLIGQTEGTVFIDVQDLIKDTFLFSFNESTTSTISILKNTSNEIQCQVWGSTLVTILSSSVLNERLKIAFAYKSGSVAVYINGVQVGTSSTTFTLPTTMDTIYLPYRTAYYAVSETARYNSIQIYKTRLTDEQLTLLTGDTYNSYAEMANSLNYILE